MMTPTKADAEPPPYHDWMVVPDTSLLPPPPRINHDTSPTSNASSDEAARAHRWTDANPLLPSKHLDQHERDSLSIGFSGLIRPSEFIGTLSVNKRQPGKWLIRSFPECRDACFLSSTPLYSANHAVWKTNTYFEVSIINLEPGAVVSIGYVALPYPTYRQAGWERASLGVHSDDGRRFVNDSYGGVDFVQPFEESHTVGIGMRFGGSENIASESESYIKPKNLEVFFVRDGCEENKWDLYEEVDSAVDHTGRLAGLEGANDLYAAVGVFGACTAEVAFGRHSWKYVPTVKSH